jgi:2,3-bisphosphoglycerate-independent phosphoglycerate mutase
MESCLDIMKYVVIIGDGMADNPLNELEGKTPLQAAVTPNLKQFPMVWSRDQMWLIYP